MLRHCFASSFGGLVFIGASLSLSATACGGAKSSATQASAQPSASAAPSGSSAEASALIAQLHGRNPQLRGVAVQLKQLGDPKAIAEGGEKLVSIADHVGGRAWRDEHRGELKAANDRARLTPTDAEFDKQLLDWQTDKLRPVLVAMEELGGDAIVAFATREAEDKSLPNDRRALSLHLLERFLANADGAPNAKLDPLRAEINKPEPEDTTPARKPSDTSMVVAGLFEPFHDCYSKAQKKNPKLDVRGVLELKVGGDGVVTDARTADVAPPELATCVEKAGKAAKFSAPASGRSFTVKVPLDFQSTP